MYSDAIKRRNIDVGDIIDINVSYCDYVSIDFMMGMNIDKRLHLFQIDIRLN